MRPADTMMPLKNGGHPNMSNVNIMEFHVSKEHVRRENRKAFYLILFLALVSAGLVAKVLSTDEISDLFFPIIGLFVFVPPIYGSYKRIREGEAAYSVLELDERNGKSLCSTKTSKSS